MRKGEILELRRSQVSFVEKTITFEAGATKNDEGRTVFMPEELFNVLREQRLCRDEKYPGCHYVFLRNGKRISHFYTGWRKATRQAGLTGKLFHDLRRTAVRNMVRDVTPEAVVMDLRTQDSQRVRPLQHCERSRPESRCREDEYP